MSDLLGRLAHRAVLTSARDSSGAAPLEPRLPGRYESFASRPRGDEQVPDLVEQHIEVVAPRMSPAQRSPLQDESTRAETPLRQPGDEPQPDRIDGPWPADRRPLGRVTAPTPAPLGTADQRAPTPSGPAEPVGAPPAPPDPQPHTSPGQLEPVIEVQRVPGPVVVVEAESREAATGHPTAPMRGAPAPPQRPEVAPRGIAFEPREPLGPLGLEPLHEREVLRIPAIADVVTPDSVVHVHIARVEVARPAPAPPAPPPPKRSPTLSLDDYLAQRTADGTGRGRAR